MPFDPSQPRDEGGQWTKVGNGNGPAEKARRAVDWLKSGEAKAAIKKLSSPENVKAAATFAIQGALFKIGGVNDPMVDVAIKDQVNRLSHDLQVTKAHARQVMLSVVRSLIKSREKE